MTAMERASINESALPVTSSVNLQNWINPERMVKSQSIDDKPYVHIDHKNSYNSSSVTSVTARRAVLIFSLMKIEACFFNSWNTGFCISLDIFFFPIYQQPRSMNIYIYKLVMASLELMYVRRNNNSTITRTKPSPTPCTSKRYW